MSFNLSNLAPWTDENSGILISEAVLGADLMNYVTVRPGYAAGTVAINVLDMSGMVFDNRSCGWSPTGTTTFDQIPVTVENIQSKQSLCVQDLRDYWLSSQMNPSAFGEELPFEQFIAAEAVKQTRLNLEQKMGAAIISEFTQANGCSLQGGTPAGLTAGNALAQVNDLIDALPQSVLSRTDLIMYMSYANFRALTRGLVVANYFHFAPGDKVLNYGLGQTVIIPGTNVTAVPVAGLGTSNRIICGPKEHIIAVTGLTDDQDKINIWYSRDNDEVRMLSAYRIGLAGLYNSFATNDLA
jgi:hypothetical protein